MILFGNGVFSSSFFRFFQGLPVKRKYNKMEFYGNVVIDDVWLRSQVMTEVEMNNMTIDTIPTWTGDTLLLAHFEDTLNAGTLTNISGNIDNWEVYRKETNESSFKLLKELSGTEESFTDVTAQPFKTYKYQVIATNDNERSEPIVGIDTYINVYNNLLIDTITNEVLVLDLDLDEGKHTLNTNYSINSGYGKYPSMMRGRNRYYTMQMKAIPISNYGSFFTTIEQSTDYMQQVENFIENGNMKILKTRKGFIRVGETYGFSCESVNINIMQQPFSISFSFVERGDISDY